MPTSTVLRSIAKALAGLSLALLALYATFGLKLIPVMGGSMTPTITEGEFLLVDTFSPHWHTIKAGEIILFKNNTNQYIVKRVLQDSTTTLIITDGVLLTPQEHHLVLDSAISLTLKSGDSLDATELFVAGDNRALSRDSRNYGPIRQHQVVGRVISIGKVRS